MSSPAEGPGQVSPTPKLPLGEAQTPCGPARTITAWPSPAALARSCFPTPGTLFSLPWTSFGLCSSLPPARPQSPGLGPPLHAWPAQPTQGSSLPSPGPASWSPALGGASGAPHSAVHRAPHTQHDSQSPGVHLAHLSHQPPPHQVPPSFQARASGTWLGPELCLEASCLHLEALSPPACGCRGRPLPRVLDRGVPRSRHRPCRAPLSSWPLPPGCGGPCWALAPSLHPGSRAFLPHTAVGV